ncbi:hypothetical protein [uncultured Microscilla sp.]|uniref:hypothetical protein n=1 Tax=uncultured Microscilla sp. TaxID=432653 RepID=UPI00260236AC|nr:hypothetical protein [uncultured Microscilla sp.]
MALGAILGGAGAIVGGITGIFTSKNNRKAAEAKAHSDQVVSKNQLEAVKIQAETDKLNALLQVRMSEQKSKDQKMTLAYVGAFVVILLIFFKN